MKQVIQPLTSKKTVIEEVPSPRNLDKTILIKSTCSLISAGTERMLVDFAKANLIEKAKQQPDKVKMVIEKAKVDGIIPTFNAVKNKLDNPLPLGYCNVGRVIEIGPSAGNFSLGDRVVSNGPHAEIVRSTNNLCAKIPDSVNDEEASFTIIGSIALQGVRLSNPTIGETFAVFGLGLIGLLTVQILKANGCRVIGIDYDEKKISLAKDFGADVINLSKVDNPVDFALKFSNELGIDAAIVTAATKSSKPIHQAAQMCRKRGRIILVGVTGLNLLREDFYEKEITFQVSASYGPGRYDPGYEEKGNDYPIGFVRWTEKRNFETVLNLIKDGKINVSKLISSSFLIENAEEAYSYMSNNPSSLGIILQYDPQKEHLNSQTISLVENYENQNINNSDSNIFEHGISFIGSGNYASGVLMPLFKKNKAKFDVVLSSGGLSSASMAKKYKFKKASTDQNEVFSSKASNTIIIATRHNTHASLVLDGLKNKKNIFVEKPLCISLNELDDIKDKYDEKSILMVGFNRRFAPHIKKIKELLSDTNEPISMIMTVNSGYIDSDHWTQDKDIGGGRIIGEVCHFIDLLLFLSGSSILSYSFSVMDSLNKDTVSINLLFKNGSIGSVHYFSNGSKSFPKEKLEIFSNGKILSLNNYRQLYGYGWKNFKKMNLWKQDKGQDNCVREFLSAITGECNSPISFKDIYDVTRVSIEIQDSLN